MRIILSDPAKSVLEGGAWIDVYDYQNKDKNITITKNKSLLFFFRAVYHSTNHVILRPVIAAIFNVILNIYQRCKQPQHSSQIPQIQPLLKTIKKSC